MIAPAPAPAPAVEAAAPSPPPRPAAGRDFAALLGSADAEPRLVPGTADVASSAVGGARPGVPGGAPPVAAESEAVALIAQITPAAAGPACVAQPSPAAGVGHPAAAADAAEPRDAAEDPAATDDTAAADAEPASAPPAAVVADAVMLAADALLPAPAGQGAAPATAPAEPNPGPARQPGARPGDAAATASAAPAAAKAADRAAPAPAVKRAAISAAGDAQPFATIQAAAGALLDAPAAADPRAPAAPADVLITHHLDLAQDHAWLDRLAQDIARSADQASPLRFALAPEHLGRLTVEIANHADGTAIRLTTETEQAQRIVAEAQPRLIAEARAQGLRVTDAQVALDQRSGGQPHQHPAAAAQQAMAAGGGGGQGAGDRARSGFQRTDFRRSAPRTAAASAPAARDLYA